MEKIKNEALLKAINQIEKQYGKGAIMQLGQKEIEKIDSISSGSLLLNQALGIGGYPKGRIIEIFGPESSGKTTLSLHAISEAQKVGGNVAFIDAEHALDIQYAKKLGVQTENLLISQPDTGEQALEICDSLIRTGEVDLIVIDSVAALVPEAEIAGEMGDSHVGLQARLMSQAMRKLSGVISKTNTIVIFINQIREKVGILYGNPETTPGGRALKFYSSIRLEIKKGEQIKDGASIVGNICKINIVKNKVAPPFKKVEIPLLYGRGFDQKEEVIDLAIDNEFINKSGSWYSIDNERICQGREKLRDYFNSNSEMFEKIKSNVLEVL